MWRKRNRQLVERRSKSIGRIRRQASTIVVKHSLACKCDWYLVIRQVLMRMRDACKSGLWIKWLINDHKAQESFGQPNGLEWFHVDDRRTDNYLAKITRSKTNKQRISFNFNKQLAIKYPISDAQFHANRSRFVHVEWTSYQNCTTKTHHTVNTHLSIPLNRSTLKFPLYAMRTCQSRVRHFTLVAVI